jgi:hypothetical protein
MINHVNHQCKRDAVEKSLILPICRADERTANCCGVKVAIVKQIRRESRQRHYVELKPYIFDKVHIFSPQRPPALPRSKLFSRVTDSTYTGQHITERRGHTTMTRVGFEHMIPVTERSNTARGHWDRHNRNFTLIKSTGLPTGK